MVEDRGDTGLDDAPGGRRDGRRRGQPTPGLPGLFTSFRANTPWLFLDIDRDKVKTMGVSMGEVFNTLQVYLGSLYVNDFNRFGRTWQVNVQGDANFRKQIEDLQAAQDPQRAGRDGAASARWPASATSAARS